MSPENGKEYAASQKSQIVLLSISIGALYWIIDSLVDSFIFNNGTFTTQLFHPSLPDLWMRLFTIGILIFFGVFTNRIIIKYRQIGDSLRESEERYESVVENIGIGISVISPDMEILSLNSQMKKWFPDIDISKKPICYRTFNSPPRENTCSYCPTCKTLSDGQTHESITETPSKDEIRNYRVLSSPIKNAEGKVIAAIEMVEDITERLRVEQEHQESEERYRLLFHRSPVGIFNYDRELRITECNDRFIDILQSTREKLIGLDMKTLHDQSVLPAIKMAIDGKEGVYEGYYHATTSAAEIWVSMRTAPLFDQQGHIKSGVGIVEDITERKKIEERIFQITHDWEDTFNSITDMVTIHDKDFNIIHANKAAQKILHLDFLNMSPQKCFRFFHGTDRPPDGCPSCDCLKHRTAYNN